MVKIRKNIMVQLPVCKTRNHSVFHSNSQQLGLIWLIQHIGMRVRILLVLHHKAADSVPSDSTAAPNVESVNTCGQI